LGLRPGEPLPAAHAEWLGALLDNVASGRPAAEPEIGLPNERFVHHHAAVVVEEVTGRGFSGAVHTGLLENASREITEGVSPAKPERLAAILDNLLGL